jgi:hypothetical protein
MEKETSRYFKFPTVDMVELQKIFKPEITTVFVCNIWTPYDTNKDSYLWASSMDLSLFDRIEVNLSAVEIGLEEVYRIERDFSNYQLMKNVFWYE